MKLLVLSLLLAQVLVRGEEEERVRLTVSFQSVEQEDSYWEDARSKYEDEAGGNSNRKGRRWLEDELPARHLYRYDHGKAIAMSVLASEVAEILSDSRFESVETDQEMTLYQTSTSEELLPYGINLIQAFNDTIPPPAYPSGNCSEPESFKVCVVDSGLLLSHPDIPYNLTSASVMGEEFEIQKGLTWYEPNARSSHGTHVSGTIVAARGNDEGVVGVLSETEGVCLMTARAFDQRGVQLSSVITEGVEWCAKNGANIINLSLGSSSEINRADKEVYDELYEKDGILIIAAAGNGGSSQLAYPASLDSVISVGATNIDNVRAPFSQFNEKVDLVAPGVDILSTISANGIFIESRPNVRIRDELMFLSVDVPSDLINQELGVVDCNFGDSRCESATGKVCLIQRGDISFFDKAKNCERGGGVAAFIYNNRSGPYSGSLGKEGIKIPVFSLSQAAGLLVQEEIQPPTSTTISIRQAGGSYGFLDGTSMAAPHVSGVAAKIWAARPDCSNIQIRQAMEESALDLGLDGRDNEYGHGLVQAQAAYDYILSEFEPPCGQLGEDEVVDEANAAAEAALQVLLEKFGLT